MSKHITLNERIQIQQELNQKHSFKEIGRNLNKDCTTIRNEIKNNFIVENIAGFGRRFNNCLNRLNCKEVGICDHCTQRPGTLCRSCGQCLSICPNFKKEICLKLSKPPYVCNSCCDRIKCTLTKHFYYAKDADKKVTERLSEARKGINLTEKELEHLDKLLKSLVKEQGQSIHHVYVNHSDELMCSEKTIYNYVDSGILSTRNIDLPRSVRYRSRQTQKSTFKVDKSCRDNRTYGDYLEFIKENPNLSIVEMDTVEGKKGESCLLTLLFTNCKFQISILRESNDSKSVTDFFNKLYEDLGLDAFRKLFPIILTDNGSEFSNPSAIEFDKDGNRRTWVFYCEPASPGEKGACENNHEFIRRILPKGKSLNSYNQKDINKMMSHINSYARGKLNDKSPFDIFSLLYSEDIALYLGISRIHPDDIILKESLMSK